MLKEVNVPTPLLSLHTFYLYYAVSFFSQNFENSETQRDETVTLNNKGWKGLFNQSLKPFWHWGNKQLKIEMNCYISDIHIDCCFSAGRRLEVGICFYTHDLVQFGPLNMICSRKLCRVKSKVRSISLVDVDVDKLVDRYLFMARL